MAELLAVTLINVNLTSAAPRPFHRLELVRNLVKNSGFFFDARDFSLRFARSRQAAPLASVTCALNLSLIEASQGTAPGDAQGNVRRAMNPQIRNIALWTIIGLLVAALVLLFHEPSQRTSIRDITFSELLTQIDQGRVHDVTISGNEITGHFADNRSFQTFAPNDPGLVQRLQSKNVQISARPLGEGGGWMMTLLSTACRFWPFSASGFSSPARCRAGWAAAPWASASRRRSF